MYNSNLAHKPRGLSYDISHTIEKREKGLSKKKKAGYIKAAIVLVFALLGAMSLLARNVTNTETGNRIKKLKEEYTVLCTENQKKEVEIGKKVDLKTIEELAVSSYKMNRARKEQIIHINVSGQDYGVVASNHAGKEKTKNHNVFAAIMEYFR